MLTRDQLIKTPPTRLTENQRRVVDFLLTRPDDALFLSAAEMGRRVGVSDATVVRVCQALGYRGVTHLKQALRKRLFEDRNTVSRMEAAVDGITDAHDLIAAVMQKDLDNLARAVNLTTQDAVCQAAGMLAAAGDIAVVGLRSAHAPAVFLASALRYLGRRVRLLTPGTGFLWDEVSTLEETSALVAFSFPRYTTLTVEMAAAARQAGANVIAVTDSEMSPLAEQADLVIAAGCDIGSYMESFVAALSLMNALVTALAFMVDESAMGHLKKLERTWERQGVYLTPRPRAGRQDRADRSTRTV